MPSQRQYFLSSFFAAFRPQPHPLTQQQQQQQQQQAKQPTTSTQTVTASSTQTAVAATSASRPRTIQAAAAAAARNTSVTIHSPRNAMPIPGASGRRRGSDSSSEGFRDAIGTSGWYIGGKGVSGEETFFKVGVVRRIKSNDGLSLDRLSL
ncbi:hypothetical protein VHEMI01562 [[Torrubiella] hemipterigena]|uniref:Uncharacterized protein n=1 Tax=[Torrubiella] hemipterigena TaxID=1531966 RepID=A0A0A1T7U7_9HYPO|nr:hypothetical protein VHEMI01562 [[Torrubiella] hemipterigena]